MDKAATDAVIIDVAIVVSIACFVVVIPAVDSDVVNFVVSSGMVVCGSSVASNTVLSV